MLQGDQGGQHGDGHTSLDNPGPTFDPGHRKGGDQ